MRGQWAAPSLWALLPPPGSVSPPPPAHLVCKDHEAVVRLAADGPAHTLGRVAHGVKGEEVVLPDLELVAQVFQPGLGGGGKEVAGAKGREQEPLLLLGTVTSAGAKKPTSCATTLRAPPAPGTVQALPQ